MRIRSMTTVSALALFGALASTGAQAAPQCNTGYISGAVGERSSWVDSDTHTVGGISSYNFTICNTSHTGQEGGTVFLLRDWELPWDPLANIDRIRTPVGWGYAIETIGTANEATGWDGGVPTWFDPADPWYDARYLGLTQVLHFYTCNAASLDTNVCPANESGNFEGPPLAPGESLGGFGFDSPYGATSSPYQASWLLQPPRSGDPDFPGLANLGGPNSPGLRAAAVSEPGGLALFALSLGALLAARARRRQND